MSFEKSEKRPLTETLKTAVPYLLLLLPPLFWAGNVVLARGITDLIPPVAFAFWRWLLAFLLLLPFTWRQTQLDWPVIRRYWPLLMLLGILGISSFNTLLYLGVQTTTAINGAVIQTAMPAMIIFISLLLFGERIRPIQLVAVLISITGAVLIVIRGDWRVLAQANIVIGDGLIFVAVWLYALYTALLRKRPFIHPMSFLTATFGLGVICLVPIYLWELASGARFILNQTIILSILYVAIFPSILAYISWNGGVAAIGASRAGFFINFVPLFAAVLSILFLDEPPQWIHAWGMGLIVLGMWLFHWLRPVQHHVIGGEELT